MTTKKSQCERILWVLGDGNWHTGLEFTRLSSPILSYTRRIFELRRDGHNIIRERINGLWRYKLEERGSDGVLRDVQHSTQEVPQR
jgi:Helix-turn-helix domain